MYQVNREWEFRKGVLQLSHLLPLHQKNEEKNNLTEYRENDDWKLNIAREVERKQENEQKYQLLCITRTQVFKRTKNQTKKNNEKSMTCSHRYVANVFGLVCFAFALFAVDPHLISVCICTWIGIEFSSYFHFISFLCFSSDWFIFIHQTFTIFYLIIICNDFHCVNLTIHRFKMPYLTNNNEKMKKEKREKKSEK